MLALGLGLVVFPIEWLRSRSADQAERRCQGWVSRIFRFFIRLMSGLGLLRVRFLHGERLCEAGTLVVANHPTLLDVVMIGSQMPQVDCIVKRDAWHKPFMRAVVHGAGYVPNDLGESLLETCAARLRQGRSLLVFPEGTRSPADGLERFSRGAAHILLAAPRPVTPVVIRCVPPALMRGQKWYALPDVRVHYEIEVCEPLSFDHLLAAGLPRAQASRQITRALRDFFVKRLHTPPGE